MKECNRIAAMVEELTKCGVEVDSHSYAVHGAGASRSAARPASFTTRTICASLFTTMHLHKRTATNAFTTPSSSVENCRMGSGLKALVQTAAGELHFGNVIAIADVLVHSLHGAAIICHNDHRIAMSFAVLGCWLENVVITDKECTDKTFPVQLTIIL